MRKIAATNDTSTLNLIRTAQDQSDKAASKAALLSLWNMLGQAATGIAVKQSYKRDSDHSLHGYTLAQRRNNLSSDAFMVFRKAVMEFDTSRGVPFMAYIAKKLGWQIRTDKRNNSKRTEHEILTDYSLESGSGIDFSKDPYCTRDLANFTKYDMEEPLASHMVRDIEGDCARNDAIELIMRCIKDNPKMSEYVKTMKQICEDGDKATDAEAAERMHCTRANTHNIHKKLLQLLEEQGVIEECRLALAA